MSHIVKLNILNQIVIRGITNNPDITIRDIKGMFLRTEIEIKLPDSLKNIFDSDYKIYFRREKSTDRFDGLRDKVFSANETETTIYLVIERFNVVEDKMIYDPNENTEYILQTNYKRFQSYNTSFDIFCIFDNSQVFKVSDDLLVGNLAYMIHERIGWPMNRISMIYQTKILEFDKNISFYNIIKDANIFVTCKAVSSMHYIEHNDNIQQEFMI